MPYIRNTGINSMSELFAMKKNMAFQAKFDHTMASFTRDYYHKKYNMNLEISKISDDMKDILSSTGHTLDQVRSPPLDGRPTKPPNAPKLYLPPIGVRLVEKYVGIDIKRRKSHYDKISADSSDQAQAKRTRNSLPQVRKNFRNILLKAPIPITITKPIDEPYVKTNDGTAVRAAIPISIAQPVDGDKLTRKSKEEAPEDSNDVSTVDKQHIKELKMQGEAEDIHVAHNARADTIMIPEEVTGGGQPVVYSAARRSSRSTYRKRVSARLLSRLDEVRQHNLNVIADKGFTKRSKTANTGAEKGGFLLDYGDGKLQTTMKIPKMKDCARPWCNPTCKTCQHRTTSKPCFKLIPTMNVDRQNMLLPQKRRGSIFSVDKDESPDVEEDDNNVTGNSRKVELMANDGDTTLDYDKKETGKAENDDADIESEQDGEEESDVESYKEDDSKIIAEIEKLLHINRSRVEKGYDKKRIGRLAQPRGGHPAEVRFSKWSLRRKRDQLREKARTAQLSELEQDNLAMIQGKIMVFLAVLNQCETTSVPRMVHLPIRENVHIHRVKPKKRNARGRRSVAFSVKPRVRLLS